MQWTSEHMQWAEQHFNISSTTCSPPHKVESYMGHLEQTYQYSWANDDISAMTASNLLKTYAERYSGILESPNERALLSSYLDTVPGLFSGRKSDGESWDEGIYPVNCVGEGESKSATLPPPEAPSFGSSPGLVSNLHDVSFGSSFGSQPLPKIQDYSTSYGAPYLHSAYSGQLGTGLASPHLSPRVLQAPALVPNYTTGPSGLSIYSYSSKEYPTQNLSNSRYCPDEMQPYIPKGIVPPTSLTHSTLPFPAYPANNLQVVAPRLLNNTANFIKQKTFYLTEQQEVNSPFENFGYNPLRSSDCPIYGINDGNIASSEQEHEFDPAEAVKPGKQQPANRQQGEVGSECRRPIAPTSYTSSRTPLESFCKFLTTSMVETNNEHINLSHSELKLGNDIATSSNLAVAEQLKSFDPQVMEMVMAEVVQQHSHVDWTYIAGLELAKTKIKEEILWPMMRPDVFSGLCTIPRTILLFGPRGTGRTLLGRCIATQLGATFLHLSGSALVTRWLDEGEKAIHASFLVAQCRQPAVVFISAVDLLLSSQVSEGSSLGRLKNELLVQLDTILSLTEVHVLVVCSTSKPEEIDESSRSRFIKRLLVPLPNSTARHQIIAQILSQQSCCLSDKDITMLVHQTKGFSGIDITLLCREVMMGLEISAPLQNQLSPLSFQDFEKVFVKVHPSTSEEEVEAYLEWDKMFGCS